jgi:DNA-binding XRE family transcriptional regulator
MSKKKRKRHAVPLAAGDRIRRFRHAQSLSQRELAELIDAGHACNLSNWECGRSRPTLRIWRKFLNLERSSSTDPHIALAREVKTSCPASDKHVEEYRLGYRRGYTHGLEMATRAAYDKAMAALADALGVDSDDPSPHEEDDNEGSE